VKLLRAADGVRLVRDVLIPMRDGVRLAADLYVPDDGDATDGLPASPLPVVMDYIPYRKDEVDPAAMRHYLELPRHGYIVARVDIRGTGGSEGHAVDEYVSQEQVDGYDAIEWLAAQPWCDGHVNMMGISYGGFTALQVATTQPPHLTSIIPVDFTDDRYTDDCHYRGGLVRMYYDIGWYGTRMIAWNAMPTDPTFAADGTREIWQRHIAEDEPYLLAWLRHQVDGPYWRQGSVADIAERITCPAFLIGGWRDGYPNPPLRLFERLAGPKKLLIGPWDHRYPDVAIPGPRIDHLHEVVRWLDHWCHGRDTGVMAEPPIVVFVQRAGSLSPTRLESDGAWRAERSWPADGALERNLVLAAAGRLAAAGESAVANESAAAGEGAVGPDRLVVDPTVGVTAGLWSGGVPFGLSGDQRDDEAHSLVYTGDPLDASLTILGRARAMLHVASSAAVVGVAVSLSDVTPDGASHLVAKGMLNGTRRRSLTEPEAMAPGAVVPLTVEFDATAWRFEAGHRLRLAIAGADWPNVWPTPEPATFEIHRGPASPSTLSLPVVPDDGSLPPPAFRQSPVVVRHGSAFEPPATWTVTRDALTGRAAAAIRVETAHTTPEGTRIERDAGCVCEVDPADPAHAMARGWHRCSSVRDGHTTEGRAEVVIASSETDFHVTIDLAITVDDDAPVTRRWDERIPRVLL
jgi:putative CocE/NonD family hydrolase